MSWDKKGDDPWEGIESHEPADNKVSKKPGRGWILYHSIGGIMLYAYVKASGLLALILGFISSDGSDPLSAASYSGKEAALSVAFVALGYYLSVRIVQAIHGSNYSIKAKGVIIALFPITYIVGGFFLTAGIRSLLSS